MSKRIAVFFAQSAVDQNSPEYSGWSGLLAGPRIDGRGLAQCAANMGYDARVFFSGWNIGRTPQPGEEWVMTRQCTRDAWRQVHQDLQANAKPGDEFWIGDSGHGSQSPTIFGYQEAMCFWDGLLTDAEQHALMCGWPAGTKVVYDFDTCFSAGMKDLAKFGSRASPYWIPSRGTPSNGQKSGDIKAAIIQNCACMASETAGDTQDIGGIFTGSRLGVWEQAKRAGNLLTWKTWLEETARVVSIIPAPQHPVLNVLGAGTSMVDDLLPV